jgi:hypothetical protein
VLYSLVEGGCQLLEISRDDIDGTLYRTASGRMSLVLHDTVPGGAGHVQQVAARLPDVLEAALRRVCDCECGPETSCYQCLRVFRNERLHERLRRGAAADLLGRLLGRKQQQAPGAPRVNIADVPALDLNHRRFLVAAAPGEVFQRVVAGQLDLYEGRLVLARCEGTTSIGRLWLRRDETGIVGVGLQPVEGQALRATPEAVEVLAVAV